MTADPTIHVLTMADERYAMPLAVMGRSLLERHRSGRPLVLRVIDDGMTADSRRAVEESWKGASEGGARWEFVEPYYGQAERLPVWGRVPALTYARLFLNDQFPDRAGRVVVLDSDVLVLADIAELFEADLGEHVLGAAVDPFIPTVSALDGLPASVRKEIPADAPYFNAGVMVVDLARWREKEVSRRALTYIERHYRELRQYDQDALNYVLHEHWRELEAGWNAQPRVTNALGVRCPEQARIAHFSGRLKPWLYQGGTEWDRAYFEVLERTAWKGFQVVGGWKALAWRVYDSPLRRLVHGLERRALAAQRTALLRWGMR
ncbi:MAG: hypothetical protein JNK87_04630 [Bryobacterales bacterium]|nr:hypothetical protein [Bryobacterales bacterium]